MAKATHVVTHPSLYLSVKGKLQQIDIGTHITLSKAQGELMVANGKVKPIGEADTANVGAVEVTAEQFAEAVAKLDKTNDKHFTNNGEPDVNALKALGIDVTAAIRNELWAVLNAE